MTCGRQLYQQKKVVTYALRPSFFHAPAGTRTPNQRIKIPLIVSYIVTGILIGPSGLHLIMNMQDIELFSELGILFLLFIIGLAFSFLHLVRFKRYIFLGGFLQVGFTILAFAIVSVAGLNFSINQSVFLGFVAALSSTAIVLKLFQEKDRLDSPDGKMVLGILLFQDLAIIPLLLFIPFLSGSHSFSSSDLLILFIKTAVFLGGTFMLARFFLPGLFKIISNTRSQELFFITVLLLFAGLTFTAHATGLSHGLGAFMAGMLIADSEYSYSTTASILPFRDLFLSFFFISTGMLLRLDVMTSSFDLILSGLGLIFLIKFGVVFLIALFLGRSLRVAIITGFSLFQIGEFSLIMLRKGLDFNLIEPELFQVFISLIILSMILTPIAISGGDKLAQSGVIVKWNKLFTTIKKAGKSKTASPVSLANHLIIIGFGVIGQSLVKAAKVAGIPYIIIEMNPKTVRQFQKSGEPIILGDATFPHILREAHVQKAHSIALTIPDSQAILSIVKAIRPAYPKLHIIARTRFSGQTNVLVQAGADVIISEEFEASIRMFRQVLQFNDVDDEVIDLFTRQIRKENYKLFLRKGGSNS